MSNMDERAYKDEKMELMDEETVRFATLLFASLASPTRLRVVELLTVGEMTVGDIAVALSLSQPSASHHLAILGRAGIVTVTPRGTARYYRLRGPRIAAILRLLTEFRQIHREAIETDDTIVVVY